MQMVRRIEVLLNCMSEKRWPRFDNVIPLVRFVIYK